MMFSLIVRNIAHGAIAYRPGWHQSCRLIANVLGFLPLEGGNMERGSVGFAKPIEAKPQNHLT